MMQAFVVGPVRIELGDRVYTEVVYVAPIDDDMLLGFDFLKKHGARLDMRRNELEMGDKIISLQLGEPITEPLIASVSADKRRVIQPNSVAKVKCKLSQKLEKDYTLQSDATSKYLVPRSVHSGGSDMVACVMNVMDNFIVMKKGMALGFATEFDEEEVQEPKLEAEVDEEGQESQPEAKVMDVQEKNSQQNIPEHIKCMVENSREHLSEEQIHKLTNCLVEFQDVFASDEFDLGDFTEIEHENMSSLYSISYGG